MSRLLVIAILAAACGHGLGERPCSDDSECPSPQKCVAGRCAGSGFCIGSAACSEDAACGGGQHCANGCCVPGESGSCSRDADCSAHPKTPVCDVAKGACVACLLARDCGPGKTCTGEVCVALPGCSSSRDCLAPTPVCDLQQHACVECLDSGDCPSLEKPGCDASHHCVAACGADGDCANPTPHCNPQGACVACLQNTDCPAGYVCDQTQYVCLQASATSCSSEKDCASNTTAPHCKPGTNGKPGTCVGCVDDTQCAAGEICSASNTCIVKQCLGDPDCAAPTPRCLIGATPQICVACLGNADCPNGGACRSDHTCLAADPCASCKPPAPACKNNTCVACVDDSTCQPGETCSPQNTCVSNKCASDNDCTQLTSTPHCDTVSGACVQCIGDEQCPQGDKCVSEACKPVCTVATQAQDCPAATPVCRVSPFPMCVQCVVSTDCPSGEVCSGSNACAVSTGCTGNAQCPPSTPVCGGGTCVQCAADGDCRNGMGCDTTAHTCTVTGSSGQICGPAGTCDNGLLCIEEGGPFGPACRPICNPYDPSCASGTVCSWLDFDGSRAFEGYCTPPNGHGALGSACDPSLIDSCEWNLFCAPTSAAAGVCRSICDPTKTGNCGVNVCNAIAGAVSNGTLEKLGYCAAASKWGQPCTTDTGVSGPDCGSALSGAGTGTALFCAPSFLPAEDPQATVLALCVYPPAAATATGGAGDSCAAHTDADCRTGVCLTDLSVTCFSGCSPTADCGRDGSGSNVFCFDIDFQTPYQSNAVASCLPTCRDDADCTALGGSLGRTCAPEQTHNGSSWRAICTPVAGSGKAGATCRGASDCASGICVTAATLQSIEIDESVPGFTATDGFCLGSALSTDCATAGTSFSQTAALPIRPEDGVQGVMGAPHPGVCWPLGCARDHDCLGLSADPSTPRVCAPYKTTTMSSVENATCNSSCAICNDTTNNPNPGGLVNAGIFGPNGKCRAVTWALHCAPSLGASKLGPGAACTTSDQCKTGHCLTPGGYCFGGCANDADCLNGTHCRSGAYLGSTFTFCQP
ncbi:MAG: hypothetical protein LC689_13410 [Myxococcales bacterium]|nr:hypothetical protein [Myxococcales bacterium]